MICIWRLYFVSYCSWNFGSIIFSNSNNAYNLVFGQMSVQEFPANTTVMDLLERAGRGTTRWTPYGFPVKEELRPRLNHEPVSDHSCKLKMGDMVEITPTIPDKSLTVYREEIQRMYDRGLSVSSIAPATTGMTGWRS